MKVRVEVSAWFKKYTGEKTNFEVEIDDSTTAYDSVYSIGVPRNEIGFVSVTSKEMVGTGKLVDEYFIPEEGDTIKAYPLIIGG